MKTGFPNYSLACKPYQLPGIFFLSSRCMLFNILYNDQIYLSKVYMSFNILYNDKMENCWTISRLKLWMGPRRCQRKKWAFEIVFFSVNSSFSFIIITRNNLFKICITCENETNPGWWDEQGREERQGRHSFQGFFLCQIKLPVEFFLTEFDQMKIAWVDTNDTDFKVSLHVRSNCQWIFEERIYSSSF